MFVSREATILHADLDAFFASVEQRTTQTARPPGHGRRRRRARGELRGEPFGVEGRGREAGRRLCPDAVVGRHEAGVPEASEAVFEVPRHDAARRADLDRRGLPRRAWVRAARRLADGDGPSGSRRPASRKVGLPITVGIAVTKFLAKVASGVAKPNGLLVVPPDDELGFLHPLPVQRLWGVGPATAAKLRGRGITTVGQGRVARRAATRLDARARGRPSPARTRSQSRPTPSAGGTASPVDPALSARSVAGRGRSTRSTSPSSGSPTGSDGGFGALGVPLGRLCSGCASTISGERHVLTRSRVRRPRRG